MVHASLAFCSKGYYNNIRRRKGPLRVQSDVEYRGPLKLTSESIEISKHFKRHFDLESSKMVIEMDIFDSSKVSDTLDRLRLASGNEKNLWAYRLTMATASGFYSCFPTFW